MAEPAQHPSDVRRLTPEDATAVTRFTDALPESERTFLKEEFDAATIERWCTDERVPRWVALGEDREVQALLSLTPGVLWSSHVGELRLVVGPEHRSRGLGKRLARLGLTEALRLGLRKVIVEVAVEQEGHIGMFTSIGFTAEALLQDHIRDGDGKLRDLVLLSHHAEGVSGSMAAIGMSGEFTT
jgi:RimJ/RimL family protein N-acetyltransferase